MNNSICVSIGDTDFGTCMQLAASLPLIEVRLDMMRMDAGQIEMLAMQCRRWIATCRPGSYPDQERMELLSAAIRAGATYVDIEYESEAGYRQTLVNLAKQMQCEIIVSYHNFESTPDVDVLERIIDRSVSIGADCVKIATTATSFADCARILSLYQRHASLIAFAMGEAGKITRVAAPFLGAGFTFASVDEAHVTAPGQLTVSEMEVIYHILSVNRI